MVVHLKHYVETKKNRQIAMEVADEAEAFRRARLALILASLLCEIRAA